MKPPANLPSQNVRVRNDVRLRLTESLDFSMTHFDKVNKGFTNLKRINCFVNVVLQSLFACPAFFNLLVGLAEHPLALGSAKVDADSIVAKLVYLAKHFDSKFGLEKPFDANVVSAEQVFQDFLAGYNPFDE